MERAQGQVTAALRAVVTVEAPAGSAACLGLANVPDRIGRLSAGMIYSLACDQQAVRLPLAAGALAGSLRTGKRCVLVTPGDPAMFVRKARLAGVELADHARSGELSLFQLTPDADKHMFRAGPAGFLRELELNVSGAGVFIVLDQADPLFMLSDPRASAEATQAYLRWVAANDHTVLGLFAPSAMAPREYLTLRRAAENFGGFAVARSSYGGGTLEVRHWFALGGASPRETFALRLHGSGVFSAPTAAQDELPPVDTIICVSGAMPTPASGCREWQEVASCAEGLQAARRSAAATLVLPFRHSGDFTTLCTAVAALRAMARPELRVVIRECGRRLRAGQALALLRLGISSVIPIDMPDLGAKRMVDQLRGTAFTRAYESEVEQVFEETAQVLGGATDSAALFCEAVEGWLAAADGFDFESCLVRIAAQGASAAGVLSRARKSGRDLLGIAKGSEVWLFLFGCPQAALAGVMQRLLPGPCERKWSVQFDPDRIVAELENLSAG